MRQLLSILFITTTTLFLAGCGSKETPATVAQKWCDLNAKVYKAADGPEKEAAKATREKFEKTMEEKYKNDDAFMKEVGKEVEKCEDSSEGRQ
ncbi:MAG TPA: hypothetical protein PKC72_08730 [Chitinophagaceae bacterium]|nr:hypothetical protein [Chitinophagaceae bacterium]